MDLSDFHRQTFLKSEPFCLRNLDVDVLLLASLTSKDVLTDDERERIETERTRLDKAATLFKLLPRGKADTFPKVLAALEECHQEHVKEFLEKTLTEIMQVNDEKEIEESDVANVSKEPSSSSSAKTGNAQQDRGSDEVDAQALREENVSFSHGSAPNRQPDTSRGHQASEVSCNELHVESDPSSSLPERPIRQADSDSLPAQASAVSSSGPPDATSSLTNNTLICQATPDCHLVAQCGDAICNAPEEFNIPQYDFVLYYSDADSEKGEEFFETMQSLGRDRGFEGVRFDEITALGYAEPRVFERSKMLNESCTYMLLYMGDNFGSCGKAKHQKDECLMTSLEEFHKRNKFVPVRTKNGPKKVAGLLSINPIVVDGKYFEETIVKMFTAEHVKKEKLERQGNLRQKKKEWEDKKRMENNSATTSAETAARPDPKREDVTTACQPIDESLPFEGEGEDTVDGGQPTAGDLTANPGTQLSGDTLDSDNQQLNSLGISSPSVHSSAEQARKSVSVTDNSTDRMLTGESGDESITSPDSQNAREEADGQASEPAKLGDVTIATIQPTMPAAAGSDVTDVTDKFTKPEAAGGDVTITNDQFTKTDTAGGVSVKASPSTSAGAGGDSSEKDEAYISIGPISLTKRDVSIGVVGLATAALAGVAILRK